jgi:DNA-binding CsgD family transcriptional regulator/tetratricopeptide (TPR) repeat protein
MNFDREQAALAPCDAALAMAERIEAEQLLATALICRGRARVQLGQESGLAELMRGLELARANGNHEFVMLGYAYMVFVLWRLGRYEDMLRYLDEGSEYGADHDFLMYEQTREAYRYRLLAMRGEWEAAEQGLRELLGADPDNPGVIGRHVLPALARLAVRQGRDDAAQQLAVARRHAERSDSLRGLVPTVIAELEHGVLGGRPEAVRAAGVQLLPFMEHRERERGELLRYLQRVGHPVVPFDGCPEEFAAGLRGDWRAAAVAWRRIGDPYEEAFALLDSGEVEPIVEAMAVFDELGARPAATLARRRLRELGVRQVPRGPRPATRTNPAGLTERQLEILRLLADGLTNAEIAARLVVSVRTVDHHVSAVLQKLGVDSRRAAASAVADLDLGSRT